MRKIFQILVGMLLVAAFVWTLIFLYEKSRPTTLAYETEQPFISDVVSQTVATGSIVPREEVQIKPTVSGVIEKVFVEPGDKVKKGDLIVKISIIPDVVKLNNAESDLEAAKINLENAQKEYFRAKNLFNQKLISESEYNNLLLDYQLKQQKVGAALANVQLIRVGASEKSGTQSNLVKSTIDGTVLSFPVKKGEMVIESNTFNEGTTVASIADMHDMIFEGYVDESEIGKIKEGMEVQITIGAIENKMLKGRLEYIAPKGELKEGAVQFKLKAAVEPRDDIVIRANYSANANIVLDRRDDVLVIPERLLKFNKDSAYVEVEVESQIFEKRVLILGLSDGINIEVVSGLNREDKVKGSAKHK